MKQTETTVGAVARPTRKDVTIAKRVLIFPVHLLSILSPAKSFRDNTIIGSRFLNTLGLHVLRTALARIIWRIRQFPLACLISPEDRLAYNRDGFIVKENFLPDEVFGEIVKEARGWNGHVWQCIQGGAATRRILLEPEVLKKMPALIKVTRDSTFLRLLKFGAAKNERPILYIQQIVNGDTPDTPDPQKKLHSDTFHPTMKAWLFLEDVDENMGPFTYVPGSNRLTIKRIKWEYRRSVDRAARGDSYSDRGSLRVHEEELPTLDLPAPKSLAVKKNTLVIANTNGFHRRGDVKPGAKNTRLEIWALSRTNPFNPWPGLGITAFSDLRDKLYLKYLERRDRKATEQGSRASWHQSSGGISD